MIALRILPEPALKAKKPEHQTISQMIKVVSGDKLFLILLLTFLINNLANAIPATLVLFFIDDVLQEKAFGGNFLAIYFLAGVAAMPIWLRISRHIGKKNSAVLSMVLAMVWFIWCFLLGVHDKWQYFAICILTGLSVGSDVALYPSMLADVIQKRSRELKKAPNSGSYFGIWNLSSKLALALAGGITLPLLAWAGYKPGVVSPNSVYYLSFTYGIVPCVFKAVAAYTLWRSPIDQER